MLYGHEALRTKEQIFFGNSYLAASAPQIEIKSFEKQIWIPRLWKLEVSEESLCNLMIARVHSGIAEND